jgi:hypothetical protein
MLKTREIGTRGTVPEVRVQDPALAPGQQSVEVARDRRLGMGARSR